MVEGCCSLFYGFGGWGVGCCLLVLGGLHCGVSLLVGARLLIILVLRLDWICWGLFAVVNSVG